MLIRPFGYGDIDPKTRLFLDVLFMPNCVVEVKRRGHYIVVPKFRERWASPLDWGAGDPLEACPFSTRVIVPNFSVVSQTIRAYV